MQNDLLPALTFTPPVISMNFEELEKKIDEIASQYSGLVVGEDDVPVIKSEMAGLNKIAKGLAEARKEASAKVSEPIRDFEARVKGLEAKVVAARSELDEQVKAHIQRERDCKRASVQFMIDALKDEHGCTDFDLPIQESWLNKTAKDKTVGAEILAAILRHKKAEADKSALEQAQRDRVMAIENHCLAMSGSRGFSLPFSRFIQLQDLSLSLADVLAQIETAFTEEATRRAEAEARGAAPAPKEPPHFLDMPLQAAPEEEPEIIKAMSISATYDARNGMAIGALYRQIKALCKTCTVQIVEVEHA